mgnify:CR=1 FL=1
MEKIANYINGELLAPVAGKYIDNYNPALGEVYSLIPDSDEQDIENAYKAAAAAAQAWGNTQAEERFRILNRIADLIDRDLDQLAMAESTDNGKPVKLAKTVDIPRASSNMRFFATSILHFANEAHGMEDRGFNYTLRQPIGVVGCISPWNLPLYLFTWKIAPALATGNAVVAKPSEVTPYTAYLFSKLCIEAGLPKGVLNIVHGLGGKVGSAITKHPRIKAISFTGGTVTGAEIARVAAPMFKKLSLELGGKNPNIIFADCDFDAAIAALAEVRPHLRGPVYAILGNHDSIRMVPGIEALDIDLLLNESVVLERDGARIHLAGIDDPHYYQVDNFDRASAAIPSEDVSILLSHSPETYRHAAHADFDLMLSGHTHGGQICLPGGIALMTNADCPRRFCRGAWRHHAMQGYTSTGSGASVVGVRYNCPPEITLHHLRARPAQ